MEQREILKTLAIQQDSIRSTNRSIGKIAESIENLTNMAEQLRAICAAQSVLIDAMLPPVLDDPAFQERLKDLHSARLARVLPTEIEDLNIEKYRQWLQGSLPTRLRHLID